jgi:hypothetical protein
MKSTIEELKKAAKEEGFKLSSKTSCCLT